MLILPKHLDHISPTIGLAMLTALAACSHDAASAPSPTKRALPAVPVVVSSARRASVPVQVKAIGTVEAYASVAVKAQVSGQLNKVHFVEGAVVKKGQLLFSLDARPFAAALQKARAELQRQRAQIAHVKATVERRKAEEQGASAEVQKSVAQHRTAVRKEKRFRDLHRKKYVTQDQFETVETNAATTEATLKASRAAAATAKAATRATGAELRVAKAAANSVRAAVRDARVKLGYTKIRSPIQGRTGRLHVHAGNVVQAHDANPLVTINQIQPIRVAFSVPERRLGEILRHRKAGSLGVTATIEGDPNPARGQLAFIDNAVDRTTGTILLKATFPNRDRRLWPGQYVQVVLTLTQKSGVIVVPSLAIQTGQKGTYVFVVEKDLRVKATPVELGIQAGSVVVVTRGLDSGQQVVTDGQSRLFPGAKIAIKSQGKPDPRK